MLRTNYSLQFYITPVRCIFIFIFLLYASNICAQKTKNEITSSSVYNKIAFSRQESQNDWDVWIMDLDGNNQKLTIDESGIYIFENTKEKCEKINFLYCPLCGCKL